MRPSRGKHIVTSGEVEEVQGVWTKLDVEAILGRVREQSSGHRAAYLAYLDAFDDCVLVGVMITSVDYTSGRGPALLSSLDGSPKYAFSSATGVTVDKPSQSVLRCLGGCEWLPERVEEADDSIPVLVRPVAIRSRAYDGVYFLPVVVHRARHIFTGQFPCS